MRTTPAERKALGELGESLATDLLLASGYTVVDRNWRCPDGEIDIVALDGATIVVCEVKTRRSAAFGSPLEAITHAKSNRLYRLAAAWRRAHDVHALPMRVDVVAVEVTADGVPRLEHFKDVV
jgi:putative endonuclease